MGSLYEEGTSSCTKQQERIRTRTRDILGTRAVRVKMVICLVRDTYHRVE